MNIVPFQNPSAQGDLYIRSIDALPTTGLTQVTSNDHFVVAHSETGHNHVIDVQENIKYYTTEDPLISYLEVIDATDKTEALLRHLRSFHTHKTISIPPGFYELRRQRELGPEGWRMAAD